MNDHDIDPRPAVGVGRTHLTARPAGNEEVFDIVAEMDSTEYTVVVSQDLQRLASHVDRLMVLENGRIRYDDEPEAVLAEDDVSQLVSVPTTVRIGTRLRSRRLVDASMLVPLDADAAVAELEPHVTPHPETEAHPRERRGATPNLRRPRTGRARRCSSDLTTFTTAIRDRFTPSGAFR